MIRVECLLLCVGGCCVFFCQMSVRIFCVSFLGELLFIFFLIWETVYNLDTVLLLGIWTVNFSSLIVARLFCFPSCLFGAEDPAQGLRHLSTHSITELRLQSFCFLNGVFQRADISNFDEVQIRHSSSSVISAF